MAKQGQHKKDAHDPRISPGRNNPRESMVITAGGYKKRETSQEQARQGKDTDPRPQAAVPKWHPDPREDPPTPTRARRVRSGRSGSDSNRS